MSSRYSTALSHLVLAGTGMYCLLQTKGGGFNFPQVTFGIITVNSLIGVWRYGNPNYGDDADGLYRFTSFCQLLFALPCITTTVWLNNGYMKELAWAHTAISIIPFVQYLGNKTNNGLVDLILTVNVVSLGVVAFMVENFYGVATAISFAFNHYCIQNEGDFMDIPAQDLYNYGFCFVAFFALRSIGSA